MVGKLVFASGQSDSSKHSNKQLSKTQVASEARIPRQSKKHFEKKEKKTKKET